MAEEEARRAGSGGGKRKKAKKGAVDHVDLVAVEARGRPNASVKVDEAERAEVDVDLTEVEAEVEVEAEAEAEAEVAQATQVEVELDAAVVGLPPGPQVFATNARFRPVAVAVGVIVALAALYGVVSMVSVAQSSVKPAGELVRNLPARMVLGQAPAAVEPVACASISGQAYTDFDGNGVATEGEHGIAGLPFAVRGGSGDVVAVTRTGIDGSFELDLPTPMVVALEAVALPEGLWPGPKPTMDVGSETMISGPHCSAALGFVWVPLEGHAPVSEVQGADLAAHEGEAAAVRSALTHGADGGVQVHGRIWADAIADRRYTSDDQAVAGATVTLLDAQGTFVAEVDAGADGRYAFVGLEPDATFTVVVDAGSRELLAARAMGSLPLTTSAPTNTFRTGDLGLPVWGVDFIFAPGGE